MEFVKSEAYERVLELTTDLGAGTAFTITDEGTQYLVTARHLLPESETTPTVRLANRFIIASQGGPVSLELPLLPVEPDGADVAVAPLPEPLTPDLSLVASPDGMVMSQQVYFLGFPFGLALQLRAGDDTQRSAFVKQAIISAGARIDGVQVLYLDGLNNPGFSGGPVVGRHFQTGATHVFGVISGYRQEHQPVYVGTEKLDDVSAPANTGIVVATQINHATDAIERAKAS